MSTRLIKQLKILCSAARAFQSSAASEQSFKSAVSLDKIYPDSTLNIAKQVKIPDGENQFSGYIPIERLIISYCRSSGPGGQNVNKLNSKVDVRFNLAEADWLPQELRDNIKQKHTHLITVAGMLVVRSDKTRSQQLNLADTLDKLRHMLRAAAVAPPPQPDHFMLEVHRRRHEKAIRQRLREKREASFTKSFRGAM